MIKSAKEARDASRKSMAETYRLEASYIKKAISESIDRATDMGLTECKVNLSQYNFCSVQAVTEELIELGYDVYSNLGLSLNIRWRYDRDVPSPIKF